MRLRNVKSTVLLAAVAIAESPVQASWRLVFLTRRFASIRRYDTPRLIIYQFDTASINLHRIIYFDGPTYSRDRSVELFMTLLEKGWPRYICTRCQKTVSSLYVVEPYVFFSLFLSFTDSLLMFYNYAKF